MMQNHLSWIGCVGCLYKCAWCSVRPGLLRDKDSRRVSTWPCWYVHRQTANSEFAYTYSVCLLTRQTGQFSKSKYCFTCPTATGIGVNQKETLLIDSAKVTIFVAVVVHPLILLFHFFNPNIIY